jgi:hypothetical protein
VVGGGVTAAVLGSSGGGSTTTAAVSSGSGSGSSTEVQHAVGSGSSAEAADGDDEDGDEVGETPIAPTQPTTPVGEGDEGLAELRELEELLASLPEEQRALVRQQFAQVEQQLKALPPAQRAMVAGQLRSALVMSKAQMKAAKVAMTAGSNPPVGDERSGGDPRLQPQDPPQAERDDDPPVAPPLAAPLPASWDGQRFDVSAYLPTAVAAVKKIAPDAKLFRIDAEGVLPDGMVDLSQGSARFGFISKARAARPANVPLGGKWDPKCQINVWVEASGVDVREWTGCKETPIPLPRCSLKLRWQKMIAKGAPRSNAIAEVGYRANVIDGRAIWFFDIGDAFDDGPSPDDC